MSKRDADSLEQYFSGARLYGDDYSPEQIREWYEQEETGYFDLLSNHYGILEGDGGYSYEYEALNRLHVIDRLLTRRFACCVALGCAAGDDVTPLAPVVDRFIAIEPAEKWWRNEIGGKPAQYLKPAVLGDIALGSGAADLVTSFGVLHHIPNITHVLSEIARVLRPGGLFAVREPISSMGDWRRQRSGLTRNERGLPVKWFEEKAASVGFRLIRRRYCMLTPLGIVTRKLGIPGNFSSRRYAIADWLLSEALSWNVHYRRDSFLRKIAPGSAFWLLERT